MNRKKADSTISKAIINDYGESLDFLEEKDVVGPDKGDYIIRCDIGWDVPTISDIPEGIFQERREHVIKAIAPAINRRTKAGIFNDGVVRVKKFRVYKKKGE